MTEISSKIVVKLKNSIYNTNTIQYSTNLGKSWIDIVNWPVNINCPNIRLESDIFLTPNTTGSKTLGKDLYFVVKNNLNFTGAGFIININNTDSYPGLFQNGNQADQSYNLNINKLALVSLNSNLFSDNNEGAGWIIQSYTNTLGKKLININNSYVHGNIDKMNTGGFIGSNSGSGIVINNSYLYSSTQTNNSDAFDAFYGTNYDLTNKINNCYYADGIWSDLEASSKLKGSPEYELDSSIRVQGIFWLQNNTQTPYTLKKNVKNNISSLKIGTCTDYTSIKNILLIDSYVNQYDKFYDSVNSETLPIIYNLSSSSEELVLFLKNNFTSINRIGFVFNNTEIIDKKFLDDKYFFITEDFEQNSNYSSMIELIVWMITTFSVSNIDYLACESLKYDLWKKYFDLISNKTGVIVGASDDLTGNVKYGGDWILESTGEDIEQIYWTNQIQGYTGLLGTPLSLSFAPGTLYIQQSGLDIQYQYGSTSPGGWTNIMDGTYEWPVTIANNDVVNGTLIVELFTNITISTATVGTGANGYFIINSSKITFEGNSKTITIDTVLNYPGLIQNGTSLLAGRPYITIQNITINSAGGSTLNPGAGWICQQYYGKMSVDCVITNCTNNAPINNINCGGIVGSYAAQSPSIINSTLLITNCTNTGDIYGGAKYSGGLIGSRAADSAATFSGSVTATDCSSSGNVGPMYGGGGIFGNYAGANLGKAFANSCTSTGTFIYGYGYGCGGIFGYNSGGSNGYAKATNCSSTGEIQDYAGGIFGSDCGKNGGSAIAQSCFSSGNISGEKAGGIFGNNAGINGSATATSCYKDVGTIGFYSGGIFGSNAGYSGSATATNCHSKGKIGISNTSTLAQGSGGIFGSQAGIQGDVTVTNCYSTGLIYSAGSGGICGPEAADGVGNSGLINIEKCFSTGEIQGNGSGGICGYRAGYDYGEANITSCYTTGNITGVNAGGICGLNAGDSSGDVTVSQCYTTGIVSGTNAQSIYGPTTASGTKTAENCYYNGSGTTTNVTFNNCYGYNGTWDTPTASTSLETLTVPIYDVSGNLTNPIGSIWVDISTDSTAPNTPYILNQFGYSPYTNNLVDTFEQTKKPGESTSSAITPGTHTYRIIGIGNGSGYQLPSSYSTIGIDSGTGVITTTVLTPVGTYNIKVLQNSEYTLTQFDLTMNLLCYLETTKILCIINGEEKWIEIKDIDKNMEIKTYLHGNKKVKTICKILLQNSINTEKNRVINKLYKLPKEKNPNLFNDLYISGQHSILVDNLNEEEEKLTLTKWTKLQSIDDKKLLMAWVNSDFEEVNDTNIYTLYQIILESEDDSKQYGIYANGILSESMSNKTFNKKKDKLTEYINLF